MARPNTSLTERAPITLDTRILDLIDKESQLMRMDRTRFLRTLIGRAMGHIHISRAPDAPTRRPLSALKGKAKVKSERMDLFLTADAKTWLSQTKVRTGGITMAALITLMVLEWCNINVLRESILRE